MMVKAVVFVAGAALFILEFMAVRLLQPTFGSDIFVWMAVITVFLVAISAGYWWSGNLADRRPSRAALAVMLLAAGLILAPATWFSRGIAEAIADHFATPSPGLSEAGAVYFKMQAPLAASLLLFFLPAMLITMVSPMAIKLETKSLGGVGRTIGLLYALSTIGGILGIQAVPFLILALTVTGSLYATAALLLFLGLILLIPAKPQGR